MRLLHVKTIMTHTFVLLDDAEQVEQEIITEPVVVRPRDLESYATERFAVDRAELEKRLSNGDTGVRPTAQV